jgi:hypothetical protein
LELIKGANLALRFLLELCALAALGYWGLETGRRPIAKIGLGIGTPLAAAAIWATLVAPGAAVPVPGALRFLLELIIFGLAVGALYSAGRPAQPRPDVRVGPVGYPPATLLRPKS